MCYLKCNLLESTSLFIILKLGSTATFINEQAMKEVLSSYHPNEYIVGYQRFGP